MQSDAENIPVKNAKDDPSFIRRFLNQDLHRKPSGLNLGTKTKKIISVVVDASPLPQGAKVKIKNCAGCGQRAEALDKI